MFGECLFGRGKVGVGPAGQRLLEPQDGFCDVVADVADGHIQLDRPVIGYGCLNSPSQISSPRAARSAMERPESLPVSEGQAQCELDDARVEQVAGIAAQRQQGSEVRESRPTPMGIQGSRNDSRTG